MAFYQPIAKQPATFQARILMERRIQLKDFPSLLKEAIQKSRNCQNSS